MDFTAKMIIKTTLKLNEGFMADLALIIVIPSENKLLFHFSRYGNL